MADDWGDDEEATQAQWLTFIEAMDILVTAHFLSTSAAKDSILDLIADGRLQLRCQREFEEFDDGPINWGHRGKVRLVLPATAKRAPVETKAAPVRKQFRPKALPSDYWLRSEGWVIEASSVDWPSSSLIGVKTCNQRQDRHRNAPSQRTRRVANGVEILRDPSIFPRPHPDMSQVPMPDETVKSPTASDIQLVDAPIIRKTRSGRRKSDPWNAWFAEVLIDIELNQLDLNTSAQDYHEAICHRIAQRDKTQECLAFDTVAKALSTIRNRWREEVNAGRITLK